MDRTQQGDVVVEQKEEMMQSFYVINVSGNHLQLTRNLWSS